MGADRGDDDRDRDERGSGRGERDPRGALWALEPPLGCEGRIREGDLADESSEQRRPRREALGLSVRDGCRDGRQEEVGARDYTKGAREREVVESLTVAEPAVHQVGGE